MLFLLITVSSSQVSHQRSGGGGEKWNTYDQTRLQQLTTSAYDPTGYRQ